MPDLAGRLSGHSTRVGAAQDMVAHGIELPAIQQTARWKSTAMVNRYGERLLAQRGAAAQLARLQGRDRPVARRWTPMPAGPAATPPEPEPQGRQRAAGQPDRQFQRQPGRIRPRRAGPDTEIGALRAGGPEAGVAGAGPPRPDASAPTASHAGPGIAPAPRNPVSAPRAAAPGPGIGKPGAPTHDRSAFIARAPP